MHSCVYWMNLTNFCFSNVEFGGVNGVGEIRHFCANNDLLPHNNPSKATTFGTFFDVTSLYAGTMQKKMPMGNYKWNTAITLHQILDTSADADVGVLSKLTSCIQKNFMIFTMACHWHLKNVKFCLNGFLRMQNLLVWSRTRCLTWLKPSLTKKLRLSLRKFEISVTHGLVVENLHRVCESSQSKWLGVYIEKNTIMRKQARNDFEKIFSS